MLETTLKYFNELSKIPRCSKNENAIINWLISWAEKNNFLYKTDNIWNIIISLPATEWKEDSKTIVLQWHVDMVCVKTKDCNHDFIKDKIKVIENEWFIEAEWTTLWADNGIWVALAMMCAWLSEHPKLELLFTVDEEKWMSWVLNLEEWFITWTKLINIDSEEEGDITIWSAWWARLQIEWDFKLFDYNFINYNFSFLWLKWWHSWIEINNSKWNIVDSLFLFLEFLWVEFELSSIKSWIAENVIPKELDVVISLDIDSNLLENKINEFILNYRKEYNENNFNIEYELINTNIQTIWIDNSLKLKEAILKSKSWVYKMSNELEWFILTSQNLWIISLVKWNLNIEYLCRSSLDDDLNKLIEQNKIAFSKIANVNIHDIYPGWAEDINSDLIKVVKDSYEGVLKKEVKISWIHAWLECWVIIKKMPIWSKAISIWPNIYWAHTVNEKCEIRSIGVLAEVLKKILINI